MHEYVEIQFYRKNKPFRIVRQTAQGFVFQESDAPERAIDLGFAPYGDATKYRMQRIRQVKGWAAGQFDVNVSVDDGSLVVRGDDPFSLPEGWYQVTANVSGVRSAKRKHSRIEVVQDKHAVQRVDLEFEERTIDVDLAAADPELLRVLSASTIDGQAAATWVGDSSVRPTKRACALNLLATLRATPTLGDPLLPEIDCLFGGRDDRIYARVSPNLFTRVQTMADAPTSRFYAEGLPHAPIHNELVTALLAFDPATVGRFDPSGLLSFRAEGSPSLQLVIARPTPAFPMEFADLDLDLGNPLQDVIGFCVHMGELLDGKPTNHLDLRKKLGKNQKIKQFLCYDVVE